MLSCKHFDSWQIKQKNDNYNTDHQKGQTLVKSNNVLHV